MNQETGESMYIAYDPGELNSDLYIQAPISDGSSMELLVVSMFSGSSLFSFKLRKTCPQIVPLWLMCIAANNSVMMLEHNCWLRILSEEFLGKFSEGLLNGTLSVILYYNLFLLDVNFNNMICLNDVTALQLLNQRYRCDLG